MTAIGLELEQKPTGSACADCFQYLTHTRDRCRDLANRIAGRGELYRASSVHLCSVGFFNPGAAGLEKPAYNHNTQGGGGGGRA